MRELKKLQQRNSGIVEFWKNVLKGIFSKHKKPRIDCKNVMYGELKEQCFDLWYGTLNESEGGAPALIFFHGGGFIGGKRFYSKILRQAHDRGVTVISAGYRLSSKKQFTIEDSISDAARCVSFLKEHSSQFKIDPTRIAVSGNSAGGVMALSVALQPNFLKTERYDNSVVCASTHNSPTFIDPLRFQEVMQLPSIQQFWYLWSKLFNASELADLKSERVQRIIKKTSPELYLDTESVPIYLDYSAVPVEEGHSYEESLVSILHSSLFGTTFKELAEKVGARCVLSHPDSRPEQRQIDFVVELLKVEV